MRLFFLLISILAFAARAEENSICVMPKTTKIKVIGETHYSDAANQLLVQLKAIAANGTGRVFWERIPAQANLDSSLKQQYISRLGLGEQKDIREHVFGMDNQILKFIENVSVVYLEWQKGVRPLKGGPPKDNASIYSLSRGLLDPYIGEVVLSDSSLSAYLKVVNFNDTYNSLLDLATSDGELFRRLILQLHEAALKSAKDNGVAVLDSDLNLESAAQSDSLDVQNYAHQSWNLRNSSMADAIKTALCSSTSELAVYISVGRGHLPGILARLSKMFPDVTSYDLESLPTPP